MTKKLHKLLQLLNEALKVRSRYVQIIKKTYFYKFISITNMSLTFISIESFFGTYYVGWCLLQDIWSAPLPCPHPTSTSQLKVA